MRWNEEVKGILKLLKVSGNFFCFEFLNNCYPRVELKNMYRFFFFPETEVEKKMTVPISMSEFPFYIIEKTISLQQVF